MLLDQQSYTSDQRRSKQTNYTMEEMSKNQSFRILKLYHYVQDKSNKKNYDVSQVSTSIPSTQKNIQSFMESKSKHLSCEQLISELNHHKQTVNTLKEENTKLKTKIHHNEKEFNKFESLIEELATSKNKYGDIQIIQLRKQLKEKSQELTQKQNELDQIKKNAKVCKLQELEIERKVFFEQTIQMKNMLSIAQDQLNFQQSKLESVAQLEEQVMKQFDIIQSLELQINKQKEQIQTQDQTIKQQNTFIKQQRQKNEQLKFQSDKFKEKLSQMQIAYSALAGKPQKDQVSKEDFHLQLKINGISNEQFKEALQELSKHNNRDQFSQILNQQLQVPQIIAKKIVGKLNNSNLFQSFSSQYGSYQCPDESDQQEAEKTIQKSLNHIKQYWDRKLQVSKNDVHQFMNTLKWNENTKNYYLLQIYKKSGNVGEFINIETLTQPFEDSQNSFYRDLKSDLSESNTKQELILSEFDGLEQQVSEKRFSKYGTDQNLIEEVSEDEEIQSQKQEDNVNDLAYIESNQEDKSQRLSEILIE